MGKRFLDFILNAAAIFAAVAALLAYSPGEWETKLRAYGVQMDTLVQLWVDYKQPLVAALVISIAVLNVLQRISLAKREAHVTDALQAKQALAFARLELLKLRTKPVRILREGIAQTQLRAEEMDPADPLVDQVRKAAEKELKETTP